jgi:hypothetical protein
MTTTRSDTGRALQWALGFTGFGLVLVAAALVAGAGDTGAAPKALLVVAVVVLALVEGLLIGGLRSEAERVKRDVERG